MSEERSRPGRPKRSYPARYEKWIPVALALIALAVVAIVAIIAGIVVGLFPL